MPLLLTLCCLLPLNVPLADPATRQETVLLLKELAGEGVIKLEYEKTRYLDPRNLDPKYVSGVFDQKERVVEIDFGRVLCNTKDMYKIEIMRRLFHPNEYELVFWKSFDGKQAMKYAKEKGQMLGEKTIASETKPYFYLTQGSIFDVFRLPRLIEDLESPYADSSWEGNESIAGCNCKILKISHFKQQPVEKGTTSLYWIDLSKGGMVLRHDLYSGKALTARMLVSRFQRYPIGVRNIWIPLDAIVNSYGTVDANRETVNRDTPVSRSVFNVMAESVQVDSKVDRTKFTLNVPNGTSVTDYVSKTRYEVGQDRRPPPKSDAETRSRLNEYLNQADQVAKQVKAPSLERNGAGVLSASFASWGLVAAGIGTLGILLIRNLRSR